VALLNSWITGAGNRTCWAFSATSPFDYKYIAETSAHELGHVLGLAHQSTYDANGLKIAEYNSGTAARAPIMGFSSGATRGLWWLGPNSVSSTTIQDDLATLSRSTNGFGYRIDDFSSLDANSASLLRDAPGSNDYSRQGVLTRTTDTDVFRFAIEITSTIFLNLNIAQTQGLSIGMLNGTLAVRNASGTQIATANSAQLGESLILSNLTPGVYFITVGSKGDYGDVGQYTLRATLPGDTNAPVAAPAGFAFETAQNVSVDFSEYVNSSLTAGDLSVSNLTTGAAAVASSSYSYNDLTNRATFSFTGILPDGNYRATIPAASVSDFAGNALSGDFLFDFFVFAGDANRDRTINIADFSTLAAGFNQPGTFSQGDFNYSGTVEIGDFSILASKFNTSLPAARPGAPASAIPAAPRAFGSAPIGDADKVDRLAGDVLV
jgi:hypothetical protein